MYIDMLRYRRHAYKEQTWQHAMLLTDNTLIMSRPGNTLITPLIYANNELPPLQFALEVSNHLNYEVEHK